MINRKKCKQLQNSILEIQKEINNLEKKLQPIIKKVHPNHQLSAINLINYLAFRSIDLRKLQDSLSEVSLSSLSHCEAHVKASINNLNALLNLLLQNNNSEKTNSSTLTVKTGHQLAKQKSESLFGKVNYKGESKIMVTMPSEASTDRKLVNSMIKSGMHIARINTAHDSESLWLQMIHQIRTESAKLKKKVLIYMDLEGPKLRIKSIHGGYKKLKKDKNDKEYIKLFSGNIISLAKANQHFSDEIKATICIETPEIIDLIKQGESVWFDDGKLGGTVVMKEKNFLLIKLLQVPEGGYKLKCEKGIMFPESELDIPALTSDDIKNLPFIAKHADMVGYSFVQKKEDISKLLNLLKKYKKPELGIILKIETKEAFTNLPNLLLEAMKAKNCGVMIARGDLAVAIGYRRIAEVQEEIMWLAEAAHLPVIWATQILENLAKKGVATRAEVSDAVKSVRAECVMLNKGPYITQVIKMIKDIDKRMAPHEDKKRKFNRQLGIANNFIIEHS